jgi:hypothetical protein
VFDKLRYSPFLQVETMTIDDLPPPGSADYDPDQNVAVINAVRE